MHATTYEPARDVVQLARRLGTAAAARELAVVPSTLRSYLTGDARPTTRYWIETAAAAIARRPGAQVIHLARAR